MKLPNIFRQNVDSHLDVVLNPAADGFLKKVLRARFDPTFVIRSPCFSYKVHGEL